MIVSLQSWESVQLFEPDSLRVVAGIDIQIGQWSSVPANSQPNRKSDFLLGSQISSGRIHKTPDDYENPGSLCASPQNILKKQIVDGRKHFYKTHKYFKRRASR